MTQLSDEKLRYYGNGVAASVVDFQRSLNAVKGDYYLIDWGAYERITKTFRRNVHDYWVTYLLIKYRRKARHRRPRQFTRWS